MSEQQPPAIPAAPAPAAETRRPDTGATLADGEWHRMHPLTPLFKGGLALIIVAGIAFANLRDRLIAWFVDLFTPEEAHYDYTGGDPVDWVLANNLLLVVLVGVFALAVVLVGIFWFVWRFQQFRITGDHVEVRKGIVFRSHRRAPLDRVQGVNLTRPFPARIIGLAKLEVVGAGNDSNVELEYLATARAESVRTDILRLASGARAARQGATDAVTRGRAADEGVAGAPASARSQLVGSMNEGVSGLISGVDLTDVAPESVVKIPTGRLIGSQLISSLLWFVVFGVIFGVTVGGIAIGSLLDGDPIDGFLGLGITLGIAIPMIVAVVGITWAQISKSLRYSIAPTPDGVRITYGLLTTVTETLPPGRIFAVEVTQSLLWRPFGWWMIRINRMSGKSAAQQSSGSVQQFNVVLPVGKRADVERVLALILPEAPVADIPLVWEHGILGPVEGDPYRTMPRRAWWRRPLSWKRHGFALTEFGLLLRRGIVWRKLAIFPLARLQGVSLSQGPVDRAQRVSGAQVHSVQGLITGYLSGLERSDALYLIDGVSAAAVSAAARDHTHRWGQYVTDADGAQVPGYPGQAPDAAVDAPPAPPAAPAPPTAAPVPPAGPPAPPAPPVGPPAPPAGPPAPPAPPVGPPAPPAGPPAPPAPPVGPPAPPAGPPAPPAGPPAPPVAPPAPPVAPPAPDRD
ncbi:PH domain-containing protein [Microbacterium foliorum]|uniref:Bacterial membrane flanked domain protein n=1 Tax=Microbacterium foliorum TaxID=104336 RepID=A0A0F0KGI6_9MICO|nr:PH domain-containing protein [Microbacterium foliorum]KJL19240.1 Bacterial membrane flanked domain protein [Microbacterium foliorum]